ncbi:MAG: hypothetical protein E7055_01675 [Lentisphaerae bacterium]|nr:hypothetical protein [Lentisphaerota bacterium]
MQNIICYVAANEPLGTVKDYANAKTQAAPTMVLGAACQIRMRLFANAEGLDPYPVSALAAITSWQWQMDTDFTAATTRKIEADNSNITVGSVTVEIDDQEYTYTEIAIPISNMLTEELVALMNGKESTSIAGELCGFDGTGALVFILQVKDFTVRGRISDTGTPTELPVEYLTAAQVRALVNGGFDVVFAQTASTTPADWHSTQTTADRYIKFRLAGDASAAWSDIVALVVGPNGANGVSPYIGANGHWFDKDGDTGVPAEISGSYVEFSSVDASGNFTFAGTTTVPTAVLTDAGHFYPVEKGSVLVNLNANTVTLNVAPYLAYDGAASFSGTWRLYFAAGSGKVDFNALPWVALASSSAVTIPTGGNAYTLSIEQNTTITFPTPVNSSCYFWLYISTGSGEDSVSLPNNITWNDAIGPMLNAPSSLFRMAFLWDPPTQKWLGSEFWHPEALS